MATTNNPWAADCLEILRRTVFPHNRLQAQIRCSRLSRMNAISFLKIDENDSEWQQGSPKRQSMDYITTRLSLAKNAAAICIQSNVRAYNVRKKYAVFVTHKFSEETVRSQSLQTIQTRNMAPDGWEMQVSP